MCRFKEKNKEKWRKLSLEEKKDFKEKTKNIENWIIKAKSLIKINYFTLFIQKKFDDAKKNNEEKPKISDISKYWKLLPKTEKEIYKNC